MHKIQPINQLPVKTQKEVQRQSYVEETHLTQLRCQNCSILSNSV